jgi:hypothetical protein
MKIMLKPMFLLLFAVAVGGCKEEQKPEEPKELIYKSLERPVDRSKSKEY